MSNPNEGVWLVHKTGIKKQVRICDVPDCLKNGYSYLDDQTGEMPEEIEPPKEPERIVVKPVVLEKPEEKPKPKKRKVPKSKRRKRTAKK
jgi:hypothetical protein